MNRIFIHTTNKVFQKEATRARMIARFVLKKLRKDKKSIDIFLLTQKEIQTINRQWHKKDAPTNVLSFVNSDVLGKFPKQFLDKNHLGEIYVSPDFVRIQKQSFDHMIVHGTLHLLGYDHIKKRDAQTMEHIEEKILDVIS